MNHDNALYLWFSCTELEKLYKHWWEALLTSLYKQRTQAQKDEVIIQRSQSESVADAGQELTFTPKFSNGASPPPYGNEVLSINQ